MNSYNLTNINHEDFNSFYELMSEAFPPIERRKLENQKKLLENDYVEVAEIVQVGKVLARSYKPKKSMEEYLKEEVEYFFPISKNKVALSKGIVASFFSGNSKEDDEQILSELEEFINTKKRKEENES